MKDSRSTNSVVEFVLIFLSICVCFIGAGIIATPTFNNICMVFGVFFILLFIRFMAEYYTGELWKRIFLILAMLIGIITKYIGTIWCIHLTRLSYALIITSFIALALSFIWKIIDG